MPTQSGFKETTPHEAMRAIAALPAGSRVLFAGGPDTGKTTFARETINFLAGSAATGVALIDADIGQSEIGPPCTVGLAIIFAGAENLPLATLHGLPLNDASFVGATAPPGHLLDMVGGVVRLTHRALLEMPTGLVLIDTPGYIEGPAARALFRALIAATGPALILGFARAEELSPVLSLVGHCGPPPVVAVLRPGPQVGRKSPTVRSTRRAARLAHFLGGASSLTLSWGSIDLLNSPLGSGEPLAPHLIKFLGNALGSQCLYGEKALDGSLYLILSGSLKQSGGLAAIEEQFKTRHVTIVPESQFGGLLCGLLDHHGHFLNIGLIQRVDYTHRAFHVLTAVKHTESVAQVMLGCVRARSDGREIGHIRPGSL
jgi:polynucleotide 5'-hydroxyl-kinase GRC3/NOL9